MVVYCGVPQCKTTGTNGLHAFPADPERRNLWMRLTKISDLGKSESVKVCRKHFKECELLTDVDGKKRLAPNAVPSLFLPGAPTLHLIHNYSSVNENIPLKRRYKRPRVRTDQQCYAEASQRAVFYDADQIDVGNEIEIDESPPEINRQKEVGQYIDIDYVKSLEAKLLRVRQEKSLILLRCRNMKSQVKRLKQKAKDSKLNDHKVLQYLRTKKNYTIDQIEFQKIQLRNAGRKKNGRRYTRSEKSLCVALYKSGPRSYRFKERYMILPSLSTIGRHSANLMFTAGKSQELLGFVKEKVKDWPEEDRICTLAFDETALKARLAYNNMMDEIEGFVELAGIRRPVFATHALCFMVRGLKIPFKQPVDFYYTYGIKSYELAELLLLVMTAVKSTGLIVIGSVSDQLQTNESTINQLMQRDFVRTPGCMLKYKVLGDTIIHCFDNPHLLKVQRNNLQTKDLHHYIQQRWTIYNSGTIDRINVKQKVASWSDVVKLYHDDRICYPRALPKIGEEHIEPKKLKIKVCVATQVFSETYGAQMLKCVEKKKMLAEASGTAHILLFFNDLFDSLNGSGPPQPNSLKGSIDEQSIHFVFWEYALSMLSKMKFVNKKTGRKDTRSRILYRLMSTIRGYQEITRFCLNKNFGEVSLRNTDSDGLENFFGCVKICCQVAKTPTIRQFRNGYTTMILNNLVGPKSISANCENDSSVALLSNIHELIEKYNSNISNESNEKQHQEFDDVICDPQFKKSDLNFLENESLSYASSLICAKLLKKMYCENCESTLQTDSDKPPLSFVLNFKKVFVVATDLIPTFCSEKPLKKLLIQEIKKRLSEKSQQGEKVAIGCVEHSSDMSNKLYDFTVTYALEIFCKTINGILSGKVKTLSRNPSDIEYLASKFYVNNRHIAKHSDIFNS